MRYRTLCLVAITTLAISGVSHASYNCLKKQHYLQREMDYAMQYGNTHRVAGLQRALDEVQLHCNSSNFQARHQQKIAEKQLKVQRRLDELALAQQQGDPKRIAKKQKKLHKAEAELLKARQESYY